MKRDVFDGLKIEGLMEALKIRRYAAAGILVGLWKTTEKFYPRGDIGRATNKQIAQRVDWTKGADKLISALIQSRWMDEILDGRLYPHDWHDHCEDAVHRYLARKTLRFSDGSLPNFSRLDSKEREEIEKRYAAQGLTANPGALWAHDRRTLGALPLPIPKPIPLPLPKPKSAGATSDSGSANSPESGCAARTTRKKSVLTQVGNLLADTGTTGPHTAESLEKERAEILNATYQRIKKLREKRVYLDWWKAALPLILDTLPTRQNSIWHILCDSLDYAERCQDAEQCKLLDLGKLKNPSGYVMKKVLEAVRAQKVRLPDAPEPLRESPLPGRAATNSSLAESGAGQKPKNGTGHSRHVQNGTYLAGNGVASPAGIVAPTAPVEDLF